MNPDFSSAMLKGFLQVRVAYRSLTSDAPGLLSERAERARIRDQAQVSDDEFNRAWRGWPIGVMARVRLWAALSIVPSEFGVMLTERGQERMEA